MLAVVDWSGVKHHHHLLLWKENFDPGKKKKKIYCRDFLVPPPSFIIHLFVLSPSTKFLFQQSHVIHTWSGKRSSCIVSHLTPEAHLAHSSHLISPKPTSARCSGLLFSQRVVKHGFRKPRAEVEGCKTRDLTSWEWGSRGSWVRGYVARVIVCSSNTRPPRLNGPSAAWWDAPVINGEELELGELTRYVHARSSVCVCTCRVRVGGWGIEREIPWRE